MLTVDGGQCGPLKLELVLLSRARRRVILAAAALVMMVPVHRRRCLVGQKWRVTARLHRVTVLLYAPLLLLTRLVDSKASVATALSWSIGERRSCCITEQYRRGWLGIAALFLLIGPITLLAHGLPILGTVEVATGRLIQFHCCFCSGLIELFCVLVGVSLVRW